MDFGDLSIAVAIPCLDEEAVIARVVSAFRAALPSARIHVYDNASTNDTAEVALAAEAVVRFEPARGKGNVVRRMFNDVDAEVYVLVDGDGTCPAEYAPGMIQHLVAGQLDMVSGARRAELGGAYRPVLLARPQPAAVAPTLAPPACPREPGCSTSTTASARRRSATSPTSFPSQKLSRTTRAFTSALQ